MLTWTTNNDVQLNTSKTKEMILGRIDSTSIPSLSTPAGAIQRVTTFKLLGLRLDAGLSWTIHINTIVSKASKRLYFLKQLRRAGVPPQQLLHFLYGSNPPSSRVCLSTLALFHHQSSVSTPGINPETSSTCRLQFTRGMSYPNILFVANRRDKFSRTFFQNMCKPVSCLHHLLPPPRNTSAVSRLRSRPS